MHIDITCANQCRDFHKVHSIFGVRLVTRRESNVILTLATICLILIKNYKHCAIDTINNFLILSMNILNGDLHWHSQIASVKMS